MKDILKRIHAADVKYSGQDMAMELFGFPRDVHYDLLVVAPGWKPHKILSEPFVVTVTAVHSYFSGYEVTLEQKRIAWVQCASGGCNLITHLASCLELDFDKLIFVGAVGSLCSDFQVGDICTPAACIDGTLAGAYLMENPRDFKPFETVVPNDWNFVEQVIGLAGFPVKLAKVFCTDSIACEYFHLDFIRSFGSELIEMETSSFYRLAALMEKPAVALLAVSDNSACGEPLVGKSQKQEERYNLGRKVRIPQLLQKILELS